MSAHAQRIASLLSADKESVFCRESKGGHACGAVRAGLQAGRRQAVGDRAAHAACREGRHTADIWVRARGGAHAEHPDHFCDAGGVPAERLIERRRALPRVERGAYSDMRCEVRAGRREAREATRLDQVARSVQGRARLCSYESGSTRGGAHAEHGAHVGDAGGVPA